MFKDIIVVIMIAPARLVLWLSKPEAKPERPYAPWKY